MRDTDRVKGRSYKGGLCLSTPYCKQKASEISKEIATLVGLCRTFDQPVEKLSGRAYLLMCLTHYLFFI
jgi:hypothetical protein